MDEISLTLPVFPIPFHANENETTTVPNNLPWQKTITFTTNNYTTVLFFFVQKPRISLHVEPSSFSFNMVNYVYLQGCPIWSIDTIDWNRGISPHISRPQAGVDGERPRRPSRDSFQLNSISLIKFRWHQRAISTGAAAAAAIINNNNNNSSNNEWRRMAQGWRPWRRRFFALLCPGDEWKGSSRRVDTFTPADSGLGWGKGIRGWCFFNLFDWWNWNLPVGFFPVALS